MPKVSHPPKYCRQTEVGRADRAFVIVSGRRISLGRYGSPESYQRYAEAISESQRRRPAPQPAPSVPTVSVLMASYLTYAVQKYGTERASEVVHTKQVFKILRRTQGDLLARDFGPKAYKQLRLAMISADWSRRYIADQLGRVKRWISWAVGEEILGPNARHALDSVPPLSVGEFGVRETEAVLPVPDDVIARTVLHLSPTVADMVSLQRLTGMRPGELVQMASQHIDRSGAVWYFRPVKHKTQKRGKRRTIALGPKAQQILAKYLFGDRCFNYSSASYRRAVHRACRRAGLEQWGPNQLRHSAATTIRPNSHWNTPK